MAELGGIPFDERCSLTETRAGTGTGEDVVLAGGAL